MKEHNSHALVLETAALGTYIPLMINCCFLPLIDIETKRRSDSGYPLGVGLMESFHVCIAYICMLASLPIVYSDQIVDKR